jgi:hypothetical protein
VLLPGTGSLLAHHSYGAFYDLQQRVILKGTVVKVSFTDPHVRLTIETAKSGAWEAELTSPDGLARSGIGADTVKTADLLEIEGSPARNPDSRVVSAVREIRRPADGWRWVSNAVRPGPRIIE